MGVRRGRKIIWTDQYGNEHDLDFVIENGGSLERQGRPVAFIEAAWRRYTKHSRNKVQEIQGAILPIAERYGWDRPFLGAVLAGDFTDGSLKQLKSLGFRILHVPYSTIVDAFSSVGVDAAFDEDTPDEEFQSRVDQIDSMCAAEVQTLRYRLADVCKDLIDHFLDELGQTLDRMVESVAILPLSGMKHVFESLADAERFVDSFQRSGTAGAFPKVRGVCDLLERRPNQWGIYRQGGTEVSVVCR